MTCIRCECEFDGNPKVDEICDECFEEQQREDIAINTADHMLDMKKEGLL